MRTLPYKTYSRLINGQKTPTSICTTCGTHLTVKHILTECLKYETLEKKMAYTWKLFEILWTRQRSEQQSFDFLKMSEL